MEFCAFFNKMYVMFISFFSKSLKKDIQISILRYVASTLIFQVKVFLQRDLTQGSYGFLKVLEIYGT